MPCTCSGDTPNLMNFRSQWPAPPTTQRQIAYSLAPQYTQQSVFDLLHREQHPGLQDEERCLSCRLPRRLWCALWATGLLHRDMQTSTGTEGGSVYGWPTTRRLRGAEAETGGGGEVVPEPNS